jgi:hypothetical protein
MSSYNFRGANKNTSVYKMFNLFEKQMTDIMCLNNYYSFCDCSFVSIQSSEKKNTLSSIEEIKTLWDADFFYHS